VLSLDVDAPRQEVDGQRYVVGGLDDADWVQNARFAGRGILAHGAEREEVRLTELEESGGAPVLAAFPIEVPHGTQFFEKVHGVAPEPDEFAKLADRCPVEVAAVNRATPWQTLMSCSMLARPV